MKIRTMFQIPRGILTELEEITDNVGFELIWLDSSNQYVVIAKTIKNIDVYKGSVLVGDTITHDGLNEAIRNAVDRLVYVLEKAFTPSRQTIITKTKVQFNERLRSHRAYLGLTIAEYADRVGTTASTLQRLETFSDYAEHLRDKSVIQRIEKFIKSEAF